MDGLLAYMYTMIQECAAQSIKLDRAFLNRCGASIQLFPGVREWFGRINAFAKSLGVQVEHYVISSGLREIIEGSGIAHEFREIYACEFYCLLAEAGRQLHQQNAVRLPHQQGHSGRFPG